MVGVYFGYRAAVTDYVENDAEQIESMADGLYPSDNSGDHPLPAEVRPADADNDADDDPEKRSAFE